MKPKHDIVEENIRKSEAFYIAYNYRRHQSDKDAK